jgi:hypothetical protein
MFPNSILMLISSIVYMLVSGLEEYQWSQTQETPDFLPRRHYCCSACAPLEGARRLESSQLAMAAMTGVRQ